MPDERNSSVNVSIDHDPQTRKGVFSDFVMARTKGGVTRIDFVQLDIDLDGGDKQAVLASRVFMSNEDVITLRDMLNDHISKNIVRPSDDSDR